jgi:exopolysaccharide biosynthesis protein
MMISSSRCGHWELLLCVLCALCVSSSAQEWNTVHEGVDYAQVEKEFSGLKVKMNLLRLDLTKVRLDVHHAMDTAIGTEKTSSIATRHGAVAAINAGFFRLDSSNWAGDTAGILKIDGLVISEPTLNRAAVFIDNREDQTYVVFEHLSTRDWYELKKRILTVDGCNRERKDNELIEYRPPFHPTTLTEPGGIEVGVIEGRVVEIRQGLGSSPIPAKGFVLSASGTRRDELKGWITKGWIKIGMKVTGFTAVDTGEVTLNRSVPFGSEDITNGVPQLIKNGKIDITWEQEKASKSFVETRHPRTAVAKLKDGKFLMITVDGRSESSGGLSLYDLADYLLSLGAVDAMNLDGGGSTTMFLDGKVVNTPSDKEGERKVGDAILVTLRKPSKSPKQR